MIEKGVRMIRERVKEIVKVRQTKRKRTRKSRRKSKSEAIEAQGQGKHFASNRNLNFSGMLAQKFLSFPYRYFGSSLLYRSPVCTGLH